MELRTFAVSRNGGFWTLALLRFWYSLTRNAQRELPPPGFAGALSRSSVDTGPASCRLRSIRMHRSPTTPGAPRWQLTCVWDQSLRKSLPMSFGGLLVASGSPSEDDGEVSSQSPTGTTSTSPDGPELPHARASFSLRAGWNVRPGREDSAVLGDDQVHHMIASVEREQGRKLGRMTSGALGGLLPGDAKPGADFSTPIWSAH